MYYLDSFLKHHSINGDPLGALKHFLLIQCDDETKKNAALFVENDCKHVMSISTQIPPLSNNNLYRKISEKPEKLPLPCPNLLACIVLKICFSGIISLASFYFYITWCIYGGCIRPQYNIESCIQK